jgi:exopolyphosphatase/guanosine-5'-triphosphate,3'-diphosphate pyrophosphatase
LLRNGDLPGFSRQEQGVLAALVLCHRGKLSNERIAQVHAGAVQQVLRLAVVLRLARRLHRTRAPTAVPTPTVDAIGRTLTLAFPTGYLADHPLLAADLTEEKRIWRRVGLRLRISDAPAQPSGSAAR